MKQLDGLPKIHIEKFQACSTRRSGILSTPQNRVFQGHFANRKRHVLRDGCIRCVIHLAVAIRPRILSVERHDLEEYRALLAAHDYVLRMHNAACCTLRIHAMNDGMSWSP